jgi:hypothetical protein
MLQSCLEINPGMPHLWTEPTYPDCRDIFLRTWTEIVPPELWEHRKADKIIQLVNGSTVDYRSRETLEPFRGPTYAGMLHDELAKDGGRAAWDLSLPALRHRRARALWCAGTSTPKQGWYSEMITTGAHPWIKWSSYDNPFWSRAILEEIEGEYSHAFARQEIYADFIAQTGRIWSDWVDAEWPHGNLWPSGYNPELPYYLAGDLGIHSAWLIIQRDVEHDVEIVVAEYTPQDEGAEQTLARIDTDYGVPALVVVGRDVNTRSITDARRPIMFVRDRWGNVPVRVPEGDAADKDWQRFALASRILDGRGRRRFAASANLRSHDRVRQNMRGILDVMRGDTWPDKPGRGEALSKDGRLEHARDAALYWAVCMHRPRYIGGQHKRDDAQ